MKNVILALIAALSLNTFAMSPVSPEQNSFAELRMGGGMPVPGGLRFRHIWITNSGEVNVREAYYGTDMNKIFEGGLEREYLLGHVDAKDLSELKAAAAGITGGGLTKATDPGCMDAPGYSYGVVKGGVILSIYSRFSCRDSQLKDKRQRPAANDIKAYLDLWNVR
jgi:hypothetical protein